jgi:hypothetical protein
MSKRDSKGRYRLLIYERQMARYRLPSFTFAFAQLGLWYVIRIRYLDWLPEMDERYLLVGGVIMLVLWLFFLMAPGRAYVQVKEDHIFLKTPFSRVEVPYGLMLNATAVRLSDIFVKARLGSVERALGMSAKRTQALRVDLERYPRAQSLLRRFFGRLIVTPGKPGLVLVVEDWMGLSVQIDSQLDAWRADAKGRPSWWADASPTKYEF